MTNEHAGFRFGFDECRNLVDPVCKRHTQHRCLVATQTLQIRRKHTMPGGLKPCDHLVPAPTAVPGAVNEDECSHVDLV